jgi:purine nucleosidase
MIIDTDGGTDDAAALWWALTDPRVDLVAITVTWGNVDLPTAAATVRRVLTAAGRTDVPVALGAAGPLGPTPLTGLSTHVHGTDGLGGHAAPWPLGPVEPVDEPAASLLCRLTAERPGELDIVTIGPLSTLAQAVEADASIVGRARSLTVMGGAVARAGNSLPIGEANIAHDPDAAATVIGAGWTTADGQPPLLVGLDVTLQALYGAEDLALADEGRTVAARFLAGPLRAYAEFYARSRQAPSGDAACHDLLAVLAAVDPTVITDAPVRPLAVDTGGSAAWGATIADFRAVAQQTRPGFAPWRVALAVDAPKLRTALHSLLA